MTLLIKNCKVLVGNDFLERNILVGDDGKIKKVAVAAELKTAKSFIKNIMLRGFFNDR